METITLKTPSLEGEIHVGVGVIEKYLPNLTKGQKNFVVTDSNVYALYEKWFARWFSGAEIFVLSAGEENKNLQSLSAILEKMAGAGLHRTSKLFAVGGGVVGDIGGLAAALYMRGIAYVQIPTTLLAQVDSSVGGKTAVDFGGIKNVVGAFYQPQAVLVDPNFLKTLPDKEIKCGVGEIIKYAALNAEIFDVIESRSDKLGDLAFLATLILPCIRHKAAVVEVDEKENGDRRSLNIGHTTGHAIELSYGFSHGESILYGIIAETYMAAVRRYCDMDFANALMSLACRALALAPKNDWSFQGVGKVADRARADKKNTEDKKIQLTIPSAKGQWTMMSLDFKDYKDLLTRLEKDLRTLGKK